MKRKPFADDCFVNIGFQAVMLLDAHSQVARADKMENLLFSHHKTILETLF